MLYYYDMINDGYSLSYSKTGGEIWSLCYVILSHFKLGELWSLFYDCNVLSCLKLGRGKGVGGRVVAVVKYGECTMLYIIILLLFVTGRWISEFVHHCYILSYFKLGGESGVCTRLLVLHSVLLQTGSRR